MVETVERVVTVSTAAMKAIQSCQWVAELALLNSIITLLGGYDISDVM